MYFLYSIHTVHIELQYMSRICRASNAYIPCKEVGATSFDDCMFILPLLDSTTGGVTWKTWERILMSCA
jgi:hypothetical protein